MLAAAGSVHTQRWANAYAGRGVEVLLVSQHAPIPGYDARVRLSRLPWSGQAGYFLNRSALRKWVGTERPDLVNAHYASGYGTTASAVREVPVVLNVWGSDVYAFPERSPLHRALVCRNIRHAACVLSTSRAMASRTAEICPGVRPVVVPFGVDLKMFAPAAPRRNGPLVIGTVRALEPVYGIDVLIEAFARLLHERPSRPLQLRIVGEGSQRTALREQAERLGVAGSVEFLGPMPHAGVAAAMRGFDIFCALSRAESFGVAAVEAAACGAPVVATAVGGLPEVVADGRTGLLVPPDDVEAAARALSRLVDDVELRERMGREGRAFVEQHYDHAHCVDRALAQLERIAKTARP